MKEQSEINDMFLVLENFLPNNGMKASYIKKLKSAILKDRRELVEKTIEMARKAEVRILYTGGADIVNRYTPAEILALLLPDDKEQAKAVSADEMYEEAKRYMQKPMQDLEDGTKFKLNTKDIYEVGLFFHLEQWLKEKQKNLSPEGTEGGGSPCTKMLQILLNAF